MTNHVARWSLSGTLALGAVVSIVSFATAPAALAQAADVAPYMVTPKADAKLRSGGGTVWYSVATLKPGTLLRVDGADGEWLRVAYPAGVACVVKASEAQLNGGMAVLSRPTTLYALDAGDPYIEACYKQVLPQKLEAGVSLKFVRNITDRSGKVDGYIVEAPAGAKGWINSGDVKKLTEAEAVKMAGSQPVVTPPVAPAVKPAPAPSPSPAPGTSPAPAPSNPAPTTPAGTNPAGINPATPMNPATGAPEVSPTTAPAPTITTGQPTAPAVTAPPPETVKPAEPTPEEIEAKKKADERTAAAKKIAAEQAAKAKRLKSLDEAFRTVTSQPIETAELEPLIGEYEKYAEELDDSAGSLRTRSYCQNKIDLLKLRVELQDRTRKMAELRKKAQDVANGIVEGVQRMEASKEYLAVGKLVTSGMYDGTRLPLLYRLQSVDADIGRTIAYITPEQSLMIEAKLGMIVGVKGDGPYDPSAKVNIIVPKAIDVLKNADGTPVAAPAATPAATPAN